MQKIILRFQPWQHPLNTKPKKLKIELRKKVRAANISYVGWAKRLHGDIQCGFSHFSHQGTSVLTRTYQGSPQGSPVVTLKYTEHNTGILWYLSSLKNQTHIHWVGRDLVSLCLSCAAVTVIQARPFISKRCVSQSSREGGSLRSRCISHLVRAFLMLHSMAEHKEKESHQA